MIGFAFFVSLLAMWWGWRDRRRARENREKAMAMLRRARLGYVLDQALSELPTVQRWQIKNLSSTNPERLRLVYGVIGELEEAGKINAYEADVILDAIALAGRR